MSYRTLSIICLIINLVKLHIPLHSLNYFKEQSCIVAFISHFLYIIQLHYLRLHPTRSCNLGFFKNGKYLFQVWRSRCVFNFLLRKKWTGSMVTNWQVRDDNFLGQVFCLALDRAKHLIHENQIKLNLMNNSYNMQYTLKLETKPLFMLRCLMISQYECMSVLN